MNNNCYIRINKSGSHSILRWLDENKIPWNKFEIMKEQDYSKDRLYKAIDSSDLKFFTIFRDPWKRAVSSYTYLFFKTTQIKKDFIKQVPLCTFKEFLKMPFEEMTDFQYFHSIPQHDFITDKNGNIDYLDHIGKLEEFSTTLKYFKSLSRKGCITVSSKCLSNSSGESGFSAYFDFNSANPLVKSLGPLPGSSGAS